MSRAARVKVSAACCRSNEIAGLGCAMRGDMSILGAEQVQIVRARGAQPPVMLANSILHHTVLGLGPLSDGAAYFRRRGEEFR